MLATGTLTLIKDLFEATGKTPKTAVLMAINDTFGQAAQNAFNTLMPKLGMPFRLLEVISYDPQARDLSVEVAKAKATGAELHLCVTRLNDAILMVREMVKQRYAPMAIISPGAPGVYEAPFSKSRLASTPNIASPTTHGSIRNRHSSSLQKRPSPSGSRTIRSTSPSAFRSKPP